MSRRDLRRSPRLGPEVDDDEEDADQTGEDPEIPTSIEDLTSEADPTAFDRTFLAADADLSIEGRFDPVAGRRQVIPRVAYVLNYNLVYNESEGRWEPKKKGRLIDDLEDGDLSEYRGSTGQFDVIDDPAGAFNGDRYLETNTKDIGNFSIVSDPGDGLNYYPERGDALRAAVQGRQFPTDSHAHISVLTSGSDPNGTNPPDCYAVFVRFDSGEVAIQKVKNGSVSKRSVKQFTASDLEGKWVEVGILPEIGGRVEGFASVPQKSRGTTVSITDSQYDSGGFSWGVRHGSDSSARDTRWDFARRVA